MTRKARVGVALATATSALLALAACSSSPSSASSASSGSGQAQHGTTQVTVAVLAPSSLQWLQAIADQEGFYAKHGVSVKTIQVQSSSELVQAVSSGSADGGIAEGNTVVSAINQGAHVIITGALFQKPALRLFGGPGVKSIAQMSGTKVTAGAVSGGTYDLLLYLLKQGGVSASKVTPVAIANSSDRVTALQNGQVKGALLIPPFDTVAQSQGSTLLATYDKDYVETPAIVNDAWAKGNTAAAKGFTEGLEDAAEWIYQPANKQKAISILDNYASVNQSDATAAYSFLIGSKIISPNLSVPADGIENLITVSGGSLNGFSLSKYVDSQYLK